MSVHLRHLPQAVLGAPSNPTYASWSAEPGIISAPQFVNTDCKAFTFTGKCPREATFCKFTHNLVTRAKFLAAHKNPDPLNKFLIKKHQLARTFINTDCAEFTTSGRCSREEDFCPLTHNQMARDEFVDFQKKQAKAMKLVAAAASGSVSAAVEIASRKTSGLESLIKTTGEQEGKLHSSRQKLQQDLPNTQIIARKRTPGKIAAPSPASTSKQKPQQPISDSELATKPGKTVTKVSAKSNAIRKQKHVQPVSKLSAATEHQIPSKVEVLKTASKQMPKSRGPTSTPCKSYSASGFCRFKNNCRFLHIDEKTQLNVGFPGEVSQTTDRAAAINTAITTSMSNGRPKSRAQIPQATTSGKNGPTSVRAIPYRPMPPSDPGCRKELSKPSEEMAESKEHLTTAVMLGSVKPVYSMVTKLPLLPEIVSPVSIATVLTNQDSTALSAHSDPSSWIVKSQKSFLDAGIDPGIKVTDLGFGCWDNGAVEFWAKRNLRPELRERLLKKYRPYIERGVLPLSATTENKRHRGSKSDFHLFFYFPGEIKAIIWGFVLRNSAYESHVYVACRTLQDGTFCRSIRPMLKSPSLCRTCSQSREIAKKFYKLAFSTSLSDDQCGMVYFNFTTDRLMLRASDPRQLVEFAEALQKEDRRRLKYLSIPLSYWINGDKNEFIRIISTFTSLRVLYMVVSDSLADEVYARDLQTLGIIKSKLREASKQRYNRKALETNVVKQTIGALKARRWGLEDIKHGEHASEEPLWEGAFLRHHSGTLSKWR